MNHHHHRTTLLTLNDDGAVFENKRAATRRTNWQKALWYCLCWVDVDIASKSRCPSLLLTFFLCFTMFKLCVRNFLNGFPVVHHLESPMMERFLADSVALLVWSRSPVHWQRPSGGNNARCREWARGWPHHCLSPQWTGRTPSSAELCPASAELSPPDSDSRCSTSASRYPATLQLNAILLQLNIVL